MDEKYQSSGPPAEQGASGLSIAGFVLSILGCTAILGLIFAIIDLTNKDGRKKGLSKAAVGICIGWAVIGLFGFVLRDKNDTKVKTTDTSTESQNAVQENSDPSVKCKVGDTFTWDGLSVTYVEFGEYTDYSKYSAPSDGKKYVYAKFYVVNNSDSKEHISYYDFEGYANNSNVDQKYFTEDNISLDLSSGKHGSGTVVFEIPKECAMSDVEIEYTYNSFADSKAIFVGEGDGTPVIAENVEMDTTSTVEYDLYKVGDTFTTKDIEIKFVECGKYTDYSEYSAPKDGYSYIYFKFEVNNLSDDDEHISYFYFDGYADGENVDAYYGMDDRLSLELSAGRSGSGTVAFEVPDDAENVVAEYTNNIWTDDIVAFEYSE